MRQHPADLEAVREGVVDHGRAAALPVDPYVAAGRLQVADREFEPQDVEVEDIAPVEVDARQPADLRESAVGPDHAAGAHRVGSAGAVGGHPDHGAALVDQLPRPGRGEVGEPRVGRAPFPEHVQDVGLRDAQQMVVGLGQDPVVDVHQHPFALDELEPVVLVAATFARVAEHPEGVE